MFYKHDREGEVGGKQMNGKEIGIAAGLAALGLILWKGKAAAATWTVATLEATDLLETSATLHGELQSLQVPTAPVSFLWGTQPGGPYSETPALIMASPGPFAHALTGLTGGTTYYFRAKAGNIIGNEKAFLCPAAPPPPVKVAPSVSTSPALNISSSSARIEGDLSDLGTAASVALSFLWGTTQGGPYQEVSVGQVSSGGTAFLDLTGLTPASTYFFRIKAVGDGTTLGDEARFDTLEVPSKLYGVRWEANNQPAEMEQGKSYNVAHRVTNTSNFVWVMGGSIQLSYHIYTAAGALVNYDGEVTNLAADVAPGEAITILGRVVAPSTLGAFTIRWDMKEGSTWFSTAGGAVLSLAVNVVAPQVINLPVYTGGMIAWFGYYMIASPEKREAEHFIEYAQSQGWNMVIFEINEDQRGVMDTAPANVQAFIAKCNLAGLRVFATINGNDTDPATYAVNLNAVLKHNATYPAYKFDGIYVDCEPPSLSSDTAHRDFIAAMAANVFPALRQLSFNGQTMGSQGMVIGIFVDPRWGGAVCADAYRALCQSVDWVDISHYRRPASAAISTCAECVRIAVEETKPFQVTVDYEEIAAPQIYDSDVGITYYEEGRDGLEAGMSALETYYMGHAVYGPFFKGVNLYHWSDRLSYLYTIVGLTPPATTLAPGAAGSVVLKVWKSDNGSQKPWGVEFRIKDALGDIHKFSKVIVVADAVGAQSLRPKTYTIPFTVPVGIPAGPTTMQAALLGIDWVNESLYSILFYTNYSSNNAALEAETMESIYAKYSSLTGLRAIPILHQETAWVPGFTVS